MKVIVDKNIPFIRERFDEVTGKLDGGTGGIVDVVYLDAPDITSEEVKDADALIIRTRTRCDASLLAGSKCQFIATATIGTDHIDLDYCRKKGITVANAPGCNAPAVAQWVFASIARMREVLEDQRPYSELTLGIVGVGHVGSIVERWGKQLGFNVLTCDPPRARREESGLFVYIEEIMDRSDIVTYHTPLIFDGVDATFHLFNQDSVDMIGKRPIVLNAARGQVTDTKALLDAMDQKKISGVATDCWENEPEIDLTLLAKACIATPHIAGYSREGKLRATQMVVNAFTEHFGLPDVDFGTRIPGVAETITWQSILDSYSPEADTLALKRSPQSFESLRNHYAYRNEPR